MSTGKKLLIAITLIVVSLLSVYAYIRNAINGLKVKPTDTRVPTPTLDDIINLTLTGEQDFEIKNPNGFGITANEVYLEFTLSDGNKLGVVQKTTDLTIPANKAVTLTVPFTLNMASLGIAVFNALKDGATAKVVGYVRFFNFFRLDIDQTITVKVKA